MQNFCRILAKKVLSGSSGLNVFQRSQESLLFLRPMAMGTDGEMLMSGEKACRKRGGGFMGVSR